MLAVDEEIKKSNLRYTGLIPFRVSRVSGAHSHGFAAVTSHWQRVGDLIRSGFESHTSRT